MNSHYGGNGRQDNDQHGEVVVIKNSFKSDEFHLEKSLPTLSPALSLSNDVNKGLQFNSLPPLSTTLSSSTPQVDKKQNELRKLSIPQRFELEGFTRFSECHLWKLMMSFYHRQGVESWAQGIVPHFITCNAFIGRAYANVLHGFIKDSLRLKSLDVNETLYIIELGTGSGKFSHFMIKALDELQKICDFPMNKIKYVMTDFTETNFNFWTTHPALKPYVESGNIDFAIFNATNDKEIVLSRSKIVLRPGSIKNPICVIANYLFDTLYHDLFQIESGVLKEGLVSVGSNRELEDDPLDPEIIKHLLNNYRYDPIESDYYKDEEDDSLHLNRLLSWYQSYYSQNNADATLLVPIGALRALRRLSALSSGKLLLISGDKGHNNPDHFRGIVDPHLAVHGSFSVMVNYHAIGMYFASKGGFAIHNPQEEASLKVSAFVLDDNRHDEMDFVGDFLEDIDKINANRADNYPNMSASFDSSISAFGPNDFFVMQKGLKEDAPTPTLRSVVALLKLGDWDPDLFYKFRDTILDQVPTAGSKLRSDICRGISRVWINNYALDNDKDIAFEVGRFYYGIRDYAKALEYYGISAKTVGEHHVTFHNMGLCYYSSGDREKALALFDSSLRLNNSYEKAKIWRDRVKNELNPPDVKPEQIELEIGGQKVFLTTIYDENIRKEPQMTINPKDSVISIQPILHDTLTPSQVESDSNQFGDVNPEENP